MGPFANISCTQGTFHQLSVQSWHHPSVFCAPAEPFVKFLYDRRAFRQLFVRPRAICQLLCISGTYGQLSVQQRDFPSTTVNFLLVRANVCQHSLRLPERSEVQLQLTFRVSAGLSINFQCSWGTFRNFLCGCVNFCQLSVRPQHCSSTFRVAERPSVNLPCDQGTFVNFTCICGTFRQLPSNFGVSEEPSVNFPCISGTFCQFQSTIRAVAGPSVSFLCICRTFHEYSVCLWNIPSTSVNFP